MTSPNKNNNDTPSIMLAPKQKFKVPKNFPSPLVLNEPKPESNLPFEKAIDCSLSKEFNGSLSAHSSLTTRDSFDRVSDDTDESDYKCCTKNAFSILDLLIYSVSKSSSELFFSKKN